MLTPILNQDGNPTGYSLDGDGLLYDGNGTLVTGWLAGIFFDGDEYTAFYINGATTGFAPEGIGIFNGVPYVGGVAYFTGWGYNGGGWDSAFSYYIAGVETTLPESGTGSWDNKCYVGGQVVVGTTPDCNGDCNGSAVLDCDGVCGGSNNWTDCDGTPCGGNNWTDCDGTQCGPAKYAGRSDSCCSSGVVDSIGDCDGPCFFPSGFNPPGWTDCGTGAGYYIMIATSQFSGQEGIVKSPLNQSGTGWWLIEDDLTPSAYWINGVASSLPESGTGSWNNKYFINGVETTLPESGTGSWNNKYFINGVETPLDANGNGFLNGLFYVGGVLANGSVQFSNVPPSPPAWGNFTYYSQGAVVSDNGSLWLLVSTGGWTVGGRPGLGYGWQQLSTGGGGLPTPSVNLAQLLGLPPFVQL
jgi:hypothetical protein